MTDPSICHIIVAAGSGSRFGADIPKQFTTLARRPVLMTTIDRMRTFGHGGHILLVLHRDWVAPWRDMCNAHAFTSPDIIIGGASRWESVKNAIEHLPSSATIVTVHDGARPILTSDVIDGVLGAVRQGAPGALPAIEVTDSLRLIADDGSNHAVDRSLYRAVQTPQAFRADLLTRAYDLPYRPVFTDDASVMEAAYPDIRLSLTPGHPANIKITHPHDLQQAERLLAALSN